MHATEKPTAVTKLARHCAHVWVFDKLRSMDPFWDEVQPGLFVMLIDNLHIFVNDWPLINEGKV